MMMEEADIVIVGAGPAGSMVAKKVAAAGFSVIIVEKRQELGAPIQCSGAISRHALLENDIDPNHEFIHEAIFGFRIMDGQQGDVEIDYRKIKPAQYGTQPGAQPLGYVVDRRRFDRYLLTEAQQAGAEAWLKAEAMGYEQLGDEVVVTVRHYNKERKIKTKIIIGADGVRSQVGKWTGMQTHIKLTELASCLQIIVEGVETTGLLEIVTGNAVAPGGYAWVFPKGKGYAEVGLGVIASSTPNNAQWHLDYFLKDSFLADRFKHAKILEVQGGGVPLAAPLKKQFANNMILVGDAARHVNPITGGGLHTALSGGSIAAKFLIEHLQSGASHSEQNLAAYQDQWLAAIGNHMWELYRVKKSIFSEKDKAVQDERLFKTMSNYFSPESAYKKV